MYTARVKFERGEEIQYISHLDMQRMVQRILRRGQIPMRYSEGFNPHPKLAFAMALAVGMTSVCEYFDVELDSWVDPDTLLKNINASAPKGFTAVQALVTEEKLPSLTSMVEESEYRIRGRVINFQAGEDILKRMEWILSQTGILQKKRNKKGKFIERDIRPLIRRLEGSMEENQMRITARLAAGSVENLRPEALVELLDPEKTLLDPEYELEFSRTFLGRKNGEALLKED